MNAPYKHRRTSNPSTAFPALNSGEIAVNVPNRQLAIGDADTTPLPLLAVRLFDARAVYFTDDLIGHGGEVLRAIATVSPGPFDPLDWESIGGGGAGGPVLAVDVINTPSGSIAAINVQAALNELDAEKAALVHVHVIGDVTGLQAALDAKATPADVAAGDALKVTKAGDTMGGVLKVVDGAVGTPGLAFVGGANYGLYYAATAVNVAVGGQKRFTFGAASSESFVNLVAPNGGATAPSLSFNGQQTSGFWYAASTVNVSIAGVLKFTFAAALMTSINPIALPADPASALHAATKQYVDAGDATLAAVDALKVAKAGDTMSGDLGISKVSPSFSLAKTASGQVSGIFGTLGALARWYLQLGNATAEGGANAGSNFVLNAYDDAGVLIGTAMSINRASRIADFPVGATTLTPAALDDTTKLATTNFVNHAARVIDPQGGSTAYTFIGADCGCIVTYYNGSAGTFTIPPNSSVAFAIGAQIDLIATGAGQLSIAPGAGVTLLSEDNKRKLTKSYSTATLVKVNTDVWILSGSLAA